MHIVILAAGKGSRLARKGQPKSLTPLASGKTILQHQLDILAQHVSLDRVIVVVGYLKEMIMEQFPNLLYVYNPNYMNENTSKSLLRAAMKCEGDMLWLNGDVVFHPSVMETLLKQSRTAMVVNSGTVGEEEVKYRTDAQGKIVAVSKHVEGAQGEALGINYVKASELPLLRQGLMECQPQDYFEKGIEYGIAKGMNVFSVVVEQHLCTEIDFPEDLERANQMLAGW